MNKQESQAARAPLSPSEPASWDSKALATAQEIALMWGQDRSQFVSKIQVAVLDAMRWVDPAGLIQGPSSVERTNTTAPAALQGAIDRLASILLDPDAPHNADYERAFAGANGPGAEERSTAEGEAEQLHNECARMPWIDRCAQCRAKSAPEQEAPLTPDDRKELPFTIRNAVEAGPGVMLVVGDYLARICRAALAASPRPLTEPVPEPRPTVIKLIYNNSNEDKRSFGTREQVYIAATPALGAKE